MVCKQQARGFYLKNYSLSITPPNGTTGGVFTIVGRGIYRFNRVPKPIAYIPPVIGVWEIRFNTQHTIYSVQVTF